MACDVGQHVRVNDVALGLYRTVLRSPPSEVHSSQDCMDCGWRGRRPVMGCVAFFAVGLIKSDDVSGWCTAEAERDFDAHRRQVLPLLRRLGRRMSNSLTIAIAAGGGFTTASTESGITEDAAPLELQRAGWVHSTGDELLQYGHVGAVVRRRSGATRVRSTTRNASLVVSDGHPYPTGIRWSRTPRRWCTPTCGRRRRAGLLLRVQPGGIADGLSAASTCFWASMVPHVDEYSIPLRPDGSIARRMTCAASLGLTNTSWEVDTVEPIIPPTPSDT